MSEELPPAIASAGQPPTLNYASAYTSVPRNRIGFLSLCGSIFVPGLGQLLARAPRRAAYVFGMYLAISVVGDGALAIPSLVPLVLVLVPLAIAFQLWNWVDAFRQGHRVERRIIGKPWVKYCLGCLLLIVSFIAPQAKLVSLLIRRYLVEGYLIPTGGMSPTLLPNDRILVHKRFEPRRWSAIAFISPQLPPNIYVQRLVGFPGETIEIRKGIVYVNGQSQSSPAGIGPYVSTDQSGRSIRSVTGRPTGTEGDPITLGPDEYYLLGDNSAVSLDSRYWQQLAPGHQLGTLPRSWMVGEATWIYWPPSRWRKLN